MSTSVQGMASHAHADLDRGISVDRFNTFLGAAQGDVDLARDLYVWNRDLSVAFLADIAILEVALRNAMHEAASARWGRHWYADHDVRLDERTLSQLSSAWGYLPRAVKNRPTDADVPGRVVAQCMFGFWTNLLDAGGRLGKEPRREELNYDALWLGAFINAFPGGRVEARKQRAQIKASALPGSEAATDELLRTTTFTRSWVHGICKNVNDLRNRVAHHEPVIDGFPLNGRQRRMSAAEGHEQCRVLARMIDRNLAAWLDTNSRVPTLLASRPELTATRS